MKRPAKMASINPQPHRSHISGVILIMLMSIMKSDSLPVKKEDLPTVPELKFMQKFGYLDTPDANSEALYKHEAVVLAIKHMQQFGALPQTGIMDNATKALLVKPRCGVVDLVKNRTSSPRQKRYIIASEGWRKQHLSYFLANWSPKLGSRDMVLRELDRAFKMWSDYSPLRFVHEEDMNADIVLAFASFYHNDGYPFDGPGNTLAHAYFPYDFAAFGGDIHFDDDENWMIGPGSGVDFFTVSTHELGHSLGLAHSYDPESIMFPYYKGYSPNFSLGYDDVQAMYDLYVRSPKFVDEPHVPQYPDRREEEEEEEEPPIRDDDRHDSEKKGDRGEADETGSRKDEQDTRKDEEDRTVEDDEDNRVDKDVEDKTVADEGETRDRVTSRAPDVVPPPIPKPEIPKIADICDGSYDTVTLIRGEMFVFKGEYMWRFRERQKMEAGYPTRFRYMFSFPKPVTRIDAAYENEIDGNIYFFSGRNVFTFNGYEFLDQSPRTLTDLGIQSNVNKLDAAFVWGKNGKTYFFSGSQYWRYNGTSRMMDPTYPHGMESWKNVPYPVDTAMRWKDGITYFFLGKKFYRFNDKKVRVEANYPLPAPAYWFSCPDYPQLPLHSHPHTKQAQASDGKL